MEASSLPTKSPETSKMNARGGKGRSTRKARLNDAARKGRAARPNVRNRLPRIVKTRGVRAPAPANDTVVADADLVPTGVVLPEDSTLDTALQPTADASEAALIDEVPAEEALDLAANDERALDASAERDDEDDDEDESSDEEYGEQAEKRQRADDEPASFLAMYFRDMAEL